MNNLRPRVFFFKLACEHELEDSENEYRFLLFTLTLLVHSGSFIKNGKHSLSYRDGRTILWQI